MKSKYRRVALEDRCQIDALLSSGFSRAQIAKRLGFHRSTIGREIIRNFSEVTYVPRKAQRLASERYLRCRRSYRLQGPLLELVKGYLMAHWSADQIRGRLKLEGMDVVCNETIYKFIRRNGGFRRYCRRLYKSQRGAGRLIQRRKGELRRSITERPRDADLRQRIGHWERDTFFCANRKSVLTLVDRKSRYTIIEKIPSFTSMEVAQLTASRLQATNKKVLSITNDNGSENRIDRVLGAKVYYCKPMRPQQRGTVENTIGLLRQYLPLKANLDDFSSDQLANITNAMNKRPRKCLNYRTPDEVFYNQRVALAVRI